MSRKKNYIIFQHKIPTNTIVRRVTTDVSEPIAKFLSKDIAHITVWTMDHVCRYLYGLNKLQHDVLLNFHVEE